MKKYTISILLYFCINPVFALDNITINDNNALFTASNQTEKLISAEYVAWGANWVWASVGIKSENKFQNPDARSSNDFLGSKFSTNIDTLGIILNGNSTIAPQKIVWHYEFEKSKNIPDAIGFGIHFNINLKAQSFESPAQDPILLENNTGWQWTTPNGKTITVRFNHPIAEVYFEHNQKSVIRTMFYKGIKEGSETTEMTVEVSPSIKISAPLSLKYGDSDKRLWHDNALLGNYSPMDLSFLNDKPAGKHGILKADAENLIFKDGTLAKFWGANVQAYALFTTKSEDVKLHAKRIAKLGMNLIRIHHHDSRWVDSNIFKTETGTTLQLSEENLKKLDWWIKCLEDEGIYVWMDMHVGRIFTSKDGIDNFADFSKGQDLKEGKGYNYYNPSLLKLMRDFNKAYLSHVNTFTGLAYKDDPAIVAILLTNENDLTHHFGNWLLADKGVPIHNKIFAADAKAFADTHKLSHDKVMQTWLPGQSQIYLNDVEHRFNQTMISDIRELGYQGIISTTNSWGYMPIMSLPSLTDGNIIDGHSYASSEELFKNPRVNPGYLTWFGQSQVTGKPFSVTEWNIETFPVIDRFTLPIFTASIASLQGWDAMMLYGYSQCPLSEQHGGSNWCAYSDPAIMGFMPAAALLFRENHVSLAKNTYQLTLNRDQFFFNNYSPSSSKAIRTILETSRLTIAMPETNELPWLKNSAENLTKPAINFSDINKDFIPANQNFVESDTKELNRNWEKGIQTINTPKSQIISGWVGWKSFDLDSVKFKIINPIAVVAVQSLDNNPINDSTNIFITAMARTDPSENNRLPFRSEPVVGNITIKAPKGLTLVPLLATGVEGEPIATEYNDGNYIINLSPESSAHWFLLKKTSKL